MLKSILFIQIRAHRPAISFNIFVDINKITESLLFAGDEFVNCLVDFVENSNSVFNAAPARGEIIAVVEHVAAIASQFLT